MSPAYLISSTTLSAAELLAPPDPLTEPPKSFTTTLAPREPKNNAYYRPKPAPAPVTTTTLLSKFNFSDILILFIFLYLNKSKLNYKYYLYI